MFQGAKMLKSILIVKIYILEENIVLTALHVVENDQSWSAQFMIVHLLPFVLFKKKQPFMTVIAIV